MSADTTRFELPGEIERCLFTMSKMYEKKGQTQLQMIVVNTKQRVQEMTTSSSWDGGSYGHTLHLMVPASIYPDSVDKKTRIEISLLEDINKIHHVQNEYIESVRLEMDTQTDADWRQQTGLQVSHKRVIAASTEDRIWGSDGYYRIFLSHKANVKKETASLKDRLRIYGITGFVAHKDIKPTKEWQTEIENALYSMDALVALLTDNFHDSDWTDQEVGFAFGRSIPIIPVKLGMDPYGFMGKFQALSCNWDDAAKEIAKILVKQDKMLNAYIKAIQSCGNWDDGNSLAELLPTIDMANTKQVTDIVAAYNSNSEVRNSFGFNGRGSSKYGLGLLHHLRRWTGKPYAYNAEGVIGV